MGTRDLGKTAETGGVDRRPGAAIAGGAILAGGSEDEVDALRRFGLDVGVAFQIADDVLDADEEEGAAYRSVRSWYQRAYGYPLGHEVRSANVRFFFTPRRLLRIARRVPLSSYLLTARQFMAATLARDPSEVVRPE